MYFRRIIPSQLMLPSQITRVGLKEIRPPYGSLPAGASGQFYVVSTTPLLPVVYANPPQLHPNKHRRDEVPSLCILVTPVVI